jgi:hypothetical protein
VALETDVDRLYALPLEAFTPERNEAARAARREGRRDEAEAIARLPKPTIAAWAINQLARRERAGIDALLEAGTKLLDAQRASLEGRGREELDQARVLVDESVAALVVSASRLLEGRASDATLARIEGTLRVAPLSPEGRERLSRGTFTAEMQSTGWDLLEGLAAALPARAPGSARSTRGATVRPPKASPRADRTSERAAEKAAVSRQREAARALREAEREQARVRRELEAADARVEKARDALAKADAALAAAKQALL